MKTKKFTAIFVFSIICISLFFCKREEVILHGNLTGVVTDAATSEPIQGASVVLSPTNDTTSTGSDGTYLFKNLTPGEYEIQASKFSYNTITKNVDVLSAKTQIIDFTLNGIPVPEISVAYLDFELDLTSLSFTISNTGKGKLTYVFTTRQDWITVDPISGDVTDETDHITVTIDKTGLSDSIYKETIEIISGVSQDTIYVYLNGLMDIDLNYYKVVTIGTQTWMAENLNVGTYIRASFDLNNLTHQENNGIIEKYCNDNNKPNSDIYGGLYQWDEMMQYHPSDSGIIGTTQGICPDGWHIPTMQEWETLFNYLGGIESANNKLREKGTTHWDEPNEGATNESGFTALPGGFFNYRGSESPPYFFSLGTNAHFLSATEYNEYMALEFHINPSLVCIWNQYKIAAASVRCIKDTALVR